MAQTWPVPGAVADLLVPPDPGGGAGFPDDVALFGTTTADDEEFDTDLSAWTVDLDVTAPNTRSVNDPFCPSRFRFRFENTTGASLRIYRVPTLDLTGDFSVTLDIQGVFDVNNRFVELLLSNSATLSGAAGIGVISYISTSPRIAFRHYTNVATPTFTAVAERQLGNTNEPRRYFFHLQRVSGTWSVWYSIDGASWMRLGNTSAATVVVSHVFIRMGAATVTHPGDLTINWIRWNRFYL
jgi:hypothetical protein